MIEPREITPLADLLKRSGAPASSLTLLKRSYNITTTHQFGMFFTSCQDLADRLHQFLPANHQHDAAMVAGMNMAWFEANQLTSEYLKKRGPLDHEGSSDDPLPAHVQDELLLAFKKLYHFDPISTWTLPDGLIGKIHREFKKGRPTFQPVKKFKTLAQAQLNDRPFKKQRTGDVVF